MNTNLKQLCEQYAIAIIKGAYKGNDCQAREHQAICEHIAAEFGIEGKARYLHDGTKNLSENIIIPFWFLPMGFDEDEALNKKKLTWLTNQYYNQYHNLEVLIGNIIKE